MGTIKIITLLEYCLDRQQYLWMKIAVNKHYPYFRMIQSKTQISQKNEYSTTK